MTVFLLEFLSCARLPSQSIHAHSMHVCQGLAIYNSVILDVTFPIVLYKCVSMIGEAKGCRSASWTLP